MIATLLTPVYKRKSRVIDSYTQSGIGLARIKVKDKENNQVQNIISDFTGNFYLHLLPGEYEVGVSHPKYEKVVKIVNNESESDLSLEIFMDHETNSDTGTVTQFKVINLNVLLYSSIASLFLSIVNIIYLPGVTSILIFLLAFLSSLFFIIKSLGWKSKQNEQFLPT